MTDLVARLRGALASTRAAMRSTGNAVFRDATQALLHLSRNSLAMIGLAVVGVIGFGAAHPDIRHDLEARAYGWLQPRVAARTDAATPTLVAAATAPGALPAAEPVPDAIARATAADPKALTRQQAAVATWLSRRYKVAPEPVSRLVQEAWAIGARTRLDPTLILAIMAIESSFNPFAQSPVGAQGLMQVMTRVHDDKYEAFGGRHAAFDPVTNLRVGVQVLKECIQRAGSIEGGLKLYVGAGNLASDGGYAGKVLTQQAMLLQVAGNKAAAATLRQVSIPRLRRAAERPAPAAPTIQPIPSENVERMPTEQVAMLR